MVRKKLVVVNLPNPTPPCIWTKKHRGPTCPQTSRFFICLADDTFLGPTVRFLGASCKLYFYFLKARYDFLLNHSESQHNLCDLDINGGEAEDELPGKIALLVYTERVAIIRS